MKKKFWKIFLAVIGCLAAIITIGNFVKPYIFPLELRTPEEFKEDLIKHRNSQKASLRNNKYELAKMISQQLNLELEQIDCNAISELELVQACSDGVIAGCKAYYKKYGYAAEFEKYSYPAKESAELKHLAQWLENREDRLEPIEFCVGNMIKRALYNKRQELKLLCGISKEKLKKVVLDGMENNLEPTVISEKIEQDLDKKINELYNFEYEKMEMDQNTILPLCESIDIKKLFERANDPNT